MYVVHKYTNIGSVRCDNSDLANALASDLGDDYGVKLFADWKGPNKATFTA